MPAFIEKLVPMDRILAPGEYLWGNTTLGGQFIVGSYSLYEGCKSVIDFYKTPSFGAKVLYAGSAGCQITAGTCYLGSVALNVYCPPAALALTGIGGVCRRLGNYCSITACVQDPLPSISKIIP